ncbi:hypothetical protein Ancab_016901 [Ancistrocladus abbreviatus]
MIDRKFFDSGKENINNSSVAFIEIEQESSDIVEQLEYEETMRDKADGEEDTSSQGCGPAFEDGPILALQARPKSWLYTKPALRVGASLNKKRKKRSGVWLSRWVADLWNINYMERQDAGWLSTGMKKTLSNNGGK